MRAKRRAPVDPNVFVEAAKRLDNRYNVHCCTAIESVLADAGDFRYVEDTRHGRYFVACLRPSWAGDEDSWYGDKWNWMRGYERQQQSRILGLLLCAEFARDGFIPPGFKKGGAK